MLKSFDNITTYSIKGFDCRSGADISAMLSQSIFTPCKDYDISRSGWVSTEDGITPLSVIRESDAVFFFRIDSKRISIPLINQRVKAASEDWMRRTGYKRVKASEKAWFKSEITAKEIKVAYVKSNYIPVLFDLDNQRLYIGTKKQEVAELVITAIRGCCESVPAVPVINDEDGLKAILSISGDGVSVVGGKFNSHKGDSFISLSNTEPLAGGLIPTGYSPEFVEVKNDYLSARVTPDMMLVAIKFTFRTARTPASIFRQVDAIKKTISNILEKQ